MPVRAIARRFWPYARPYRPWLILTGLFIVLDAAIETAAVWLFKVLVDEVLVPRDIHALVWVGAPVRGGHGRRRRGRVRRRRAVDVGQRALPPRPAHALLRAPADAAARLLRGPAARRRPVAPDGRHPGDRVVRALRRGRRAQLRAARRLLRAARSSTCSGTSPWWRSSSGRSSTSRRGGRRRCSSARRARSGGGRGRSARSPRRASRTWRSSRPTGARTPSASASTSRTSAPFRAQMTATRLRAGFGPLVELIELAGVLLVMAYGTVKLSQGALSLGGLLVFMAYLSKLFSPVRGLSRLTTGLFSASASAERVIEFLDERPAVADPTGAAAGRPAAWRGPLRGRALRLSGARPRRRCAASTWRSGPARCSPWSGRAARASPRLRGCCCASPTPPRGECCSTARTSAPPRSPTCAPTSPSCCRRRWSSTRRCSRTSPTGAPGRRARRSRRRRARRTRTTSSRPCRTATTAASASAGGASPAASASGSPSRAR